VITPAELRQMADRRPVTLAEIQKAACDAVRHGQAYVDSGDLGGRPMQSNVADDLRHIGYAVFVEGDGSWLISWKQ
jgi:hypothetical protein